MKNLTLENIAKLCGAYHGPAEDLKREITDITTDSRTVKAGGLFAAIVGERVDGHRFIPDVYQKGALCVLCEREPADAKGAYIVVDNTQKALMAIAEFYRQQLDVKVVGITGSVGKTSTKETVAAVLSEKYRVLKTLGNFNNELGLPLTVFRLREEDEVAVLEMGINHFGEMHRLSKIARPDICVITNIGTCHLEFLGDRDGVLRAKSEIFDFIAPDGQIVLNGDDDKLAALHEVKGISPVFFGFGENSRYRATDIESVGLKGVKCRIHDEDGSFDVVVPVPGRHAVLNALAATAVGAALGMSHGEIRRGIEKLKTLPGRFRVIHRPDLTVVDDCYNANPVSMKASLQVLAEERTRKVAVLGDMGELGERERELHREVGETVGSLGIQVGVFVGALARDMAEAAQKTDPGMEIHTLKSVEEALKELPGWLLPGDTVLVKASRFMHFEKIVDALTQNND